MFSQKVLDIKSIDTALTHALSQSINDYKSASHNSVEFWAETDLVRNIENEISKLHSDSNLSNNSSAFNLSDHKDPPTTGGFNITFGLQISIGYKVGFRGHIDAGYGNRNGAFGYSTSVHFAAYNKGIGTAANSKDLVFDLTAAVQLTVGGGYDTPLQSYTLNYNTTSPIKNDFKSSISYGQLLTWNSALNKGHKFNIDDIQREGMFGLRVADINVSTNNDTHRFPYFGGKTDKGYTGGISLTTPLFEVGFQNFSGDFNKQGAAELRRSTLTKEIKRLKNVDKSSKDQDKIDALKKELKELTNTNFHTQTNYQKSLNKASTYFSMNLNDNSNVTVDLIGDAWLQNFIHRNIKDLRFEYDYHKEDIWFGKKF